jgi:lysophospholipase L1-like esterase
MSLGDGLTVGSGSGVSSYNAGYRGRLSVALKAAHVSFDFVGSASTGNRAKMDTNHEGHSTYRLNDFTTNVGRWMSGAQPDVVLLWAGRQDVTANYRMAEAPARLAALVNAIRQASPAVKIVIATIPEFGSSAVVTRTLSYNKVVRDYVASQANTGDITLVDMEGVLKSGDVSGSNPNDYGYEKLADKWIDALTGVVPHDGTLGEPPLRVMPLGSSVTRGTGSSASSDSAGYRGYLQRHLDSLGIYYDFVGSLNHGNSNLIDTDHEGHYGWRIDQVSAQASAWVAKEKPDIVLLHTGGNDCNQNYRLSEAPQRLSQLLDEIRAASPGVKIVVATLLNSSNATMQARATKYNTGVRSVVESHYNKYGDVYLAEMEGVGKIGADFTDSLHPNDSGYSKMSYVWSGAISRILFG